MFATSCDDKSLMPTVDGGGEKRRFAGDAMGCWTLILWSYGYTGETKAQKQTAHSTMQQNRQLTSV